MNLFELPWNALACFEALLLLLIAREMVLTFRLHRTHPERGIAWFNALILLGLFIAVFAGGVVLLLREQRLSETVPIYPGSRYAPERELLTSSDNWVFVTHDTTPRIEEYYQSMATSSGYKIIADQETNPARILFVKDGKNFFLTILSQGDSRFLFYSDKGDVMVTQK